MSWYLRRGCFADMMFCRRMISYERWQGRRRRPRMRAEAVKYVVREGDANLYRRGVRTRKAFTRMQALCRGWLVRRKYHVRILEKETVDGSGKTDKDECYSTDKGRQCREDACSPNISTDGTGMHRSEAAIASTCKPKSNLDEKETWMKRCCSNLMTTPCFRAN